MSTTVTEDQIRMYAKLLKIPTFTTYKEALRQLSPDSDIGEILLSLMKTEYEQRQENQNLNRLKRAGFPFTKTYVINLREICKDKERLVKESRFHENGI